MKMNKISRISFLWSKIKSNVTSFSFVLSLLLGGLCFSSQAADAKWYPGRLLVKPKQGVSTVALQSFNKTMGITASRVLEAADNDWQVIDFNPLENVQDKAKEYLKSGLVAAVEPDYIWTIANVPDDPAFTVPDQSYSFVVTDATKAWDVITDGIKTNIVASPTGLKTNITEIIVAVVDTGVDYTHEDLVDNMWVNPNPSFGDVHGIKVANGQKTGDPMDFHGHGSHVAGTIGARGNNALGTAGVCWNVKIMACNILDTGASSDIMEGIAYARKRGAHVINMSLGGPRGTYSAAFLAELKNCRAANMMVVCAAGNESNDNDVNLSYPCNYSTYLDNVISVGSSTSTDEPSVFSNYGRRSVNIFAPGSDIYSVRRGGGYTIMSGTSMATPFVSGAVALCMAAHPDENYLQIKERLYNNVDKVPAMAKLCTTGGRINVAKAIFSNQTQDGLNYSVLNNVAVLTGCNNDTNSIVVPANIGHTEVTAIADGAFAKSVFLEEVTLGTNITSIGSSAFEGCESLNQITFNHNPLLKIGSMAFAGCKSLEQIALPATLSSTLGYRWVSGCNSLSAISVEEGNSTYSSLDGVLYSKDGRTLHVFPQAKSAAAYILPEIVANVGDFAFENSNLESANFNKVLRLGEGAFYQSINLQSVTFGLNLTSIGKGAFEGCSSLESLTFKGNAPAAMMDSFIGIPENVTVYYPSAGLSWEIIDGKWYGMTAVEVEAAPEIACNKEEESNFTLNYTGVLYSSPDGKTWTKVEEAQSPYKASINSKMRFYRVFAE
mgnify:CR=1 FL=1